MKEFILYYRICKRNNWVLIYNHKVNMYDAFETYLNVTNRDHIEVIKDFRK